MSALANLTPGPVLDYVSVVKRFFGRQYAAHERYWWRDENRYNTDLAVHTEFNAALLRVAAWRGPGTALDLAAGEGVGAIRLAKLSYRIDAVEMSTLTRSSA